MSCWRLAVAATNAAPWPLPSWASVILNYHTQTHRHTEVHRHLDRQTDRETETVFDLLTVTVVVCRSVSCHVSVCLSVCLSQFLCLFAIHVQNWLACVDLDTSTHSSSKLSLTQWHSADVLSHHWPPTHRQTDTQTHRLTDWLTKWLANDTATIL